MKCQIPDFKKKVKAEVEVKGKELELQPLT
jgi:hypothetical protein